MKTYTKLLIVPVFLTAVACKGNSNSNPADGTLNSDLSAAQQESVSAAERTGDASAPVHHIHHDSYSGSSSTSQAPPPSTHVEKNGGRDAAIGAGAGAVLGAVTSHDKLKGGVIGAAAGGILGGVIGNNVDTKKVPNQ
ncbi:MAG TPA: YMGG-like glycine zipper-containing protein [Gemmatimonadaceae bacterium]|jgi:hypothetical protein|nr:YMGG-like glycine zipper-containing protein [Gemmatimonadaceae bacterium]